MISDDILCDSGNTSLCSLGIDSSFVVFQDKTLVIREARDMTLPQAIGKSYQAMESVIAQLASCCRLSALLFILASLRLKCYLDALRNL